ncbi:MAG: ABC transporter permease [Acidimicrobiia bacterium]
MKVLAICLSNIRRMLRDRSNIFFVFVFPIAIILLIGVQFGGGVDPAVGITAEDDGDIATSITQALQTTEGIETRIFPGEEELEDAVEHGNVQVGLFLPAGMDEHASSGQIVDIGSVVRPDGFGRQLQSVVSSVIAAVMKPVGAAQFASNETGSSFETSLQVSGELSETIVATEVEVRTVGEALFPDTLGQFDLGAAQQLVLFTFLTALAGSSALILTRQLGISSRMLSTPTSVRTVITGESAGRFGVAITQGIYIIAMTWVIFSVSWGDPLGAFLTLVAFSAVGAGAGMLIGATLNNDQQASGVGVILSLGLAALGGSMLPSELFSPTMQNVAHITPHAWALDAFAELVRQDATTIDILPELGVLILYAAVLLGLAGWRLRVAITRP